MQQQSIKPEDKSDSSSASITRSPNTLPEHWFGRYHLEDFDYQFLQISTHKFPCWVQRHINPPPITRCTIAIIKKQQECRLVYCTCQKKLADSFLHLKTIRTIPKRQDFPQKQEGEFKYTIALAKEQGE